MRNPLDVESLVNWLEKQPPAMRYDWDRVSTCVVGRYLQSLGIKDEWDLSRAYFSFDATGHRQMHIGRPRPWTYGAALERARAYLERKDLLERKALVAA